MLFGDERVLILKEDYDYDAPDIIKLGFGAATGSETNNHRIRNLAVGIFEPDLLKTPQTENAERRACEGDPVEFELELDRLLLDSKSFIQCIQLYREESDVPLPTFQDDGAEHLNCGIADICNTCIDVDYTQGVEKAVLGHSMLILIRK